MTLLVQFSPDEQNWHDSEIITSTVPVNTLSGQVILSLPGGKNYIRIIAIDDVGNVGLHSAVKIVNLPHKLYLPIILR